MSIKGYNFYAERPVMSSFYNRKKQGYELSADNLTESVLNALWVDELVGDADIAELFNTSADDVFEIRRQYGINRVACIKKYADKTYSILGSLGASIMAL